MKEPEVKIAYEYCCKRIWADIRTRSKRKIKELWEIFDKYGLETWDEEKLEWEGDGVEFFAFKELLRELERRGYKVRYEIDW